MGTTNRRTFLAGCTGLALGARLTPVFAASAEAGPTLGALAARTGRFFGSAVASDTIRENGEYFRLLERECTLFVPEWEMKWGALVRKLGEAPEYKFVDQIVAAAARSGKQLRGHTLIWHEHLPDGAAELATAADWDRFVVPHVTALAARHAGAVRQWDVVNEAIEPRDGGKDLMRRTPFYRMLGPDYVAEAFRLAAKAAPDARLYLNDYNLVYDESWQEERRTGVLKLIERLRKADVPIHGMGLQAHLDTRFVYREKILSGFLDALTDFGLEIAITELDVREADGAGGLDLPARRQRAADEVERVLAVVLDRTALTGIVTWGLSDAQSWLRTTRPIPDNQGLPYGDALEPAPMRDTLVRLFAGARKRNPDGA